MRIVLASDHGGFRLKNALVASLKAAGHEVTDLGATSTEPSDYADYAHRVAEAIEQKTHDRGILVCGTGVGMSMSANRHAGVRAVNCSDTFTARHSRSHNDANVLTLGERVVGPGLAQDIVDVWLATAWSLDERHVRRVAKIEP